MTRNPEPPAAFGEFVTSIIAAAMTDPTLSHITFRASIADADTIVLNTDLPASRVKILSAVTEVFKRLLYPEYANISWDWSSPEHIAAHVQADPVSGGPSRYVKIVFDPAWIEPFDLDQIATALNRILLPQLGVGVVRESDHLLLSQSDAPVTKMIAMNAVIAGLKTIGPDRTYEWRWRTGDKRSAFISYEGQYNYLFNVDFPIEWRQFSDPATECENCGAENVEIFETTDTHEMLCGECALHCDDCGQWSTRADARDTVDGPVCQACGEEYCSCERCNRVVPCDDTHTVSDENWCDRCYENNTWSCDSCNESFPEGAESFTVQPNDVSICEGCFQSGDYFSCDGCNQTFHNDNLGGTEEGEAFCDDCWSEHQSEEEEGDAEYERPHTPARAAPARPVPSNLRGYHSHARHWNRYGQAARSIWYGVELEAVKKPLGSDFMPIAQYIEQTYGRMGGKEFLFTERDGSLKLNPLSQNEPVKGFETIFHPMSPEFIKANEELFGKILSDMISRGMVSYEGPQLGISTGMHVTITYSSLRDWERQKFLALIFDNKRLMMILSRRPKKHIEHYASLEAPYPISQMVRQKRGYESKYVAVNLKRPDSESDVELAEVRIFRGTLYLKSFLMNLELVIACVEFARDIRFGLRDCTTDNLLGYIVSKRKLYPNLFAWVKDKKLV